MIAPVYNKLANHQINKVGNALIYLSGQIVGLKKTKALKLVYLLDEMSIRKNGIPFFNFSYKVWKFGPVQEELFIDLSEDLNLLGNFVEKDPTTSVIKAMDEFDDGEFSDADLHLLDEVIREFGGMSAEQLVEYTHRPNSPWYQVAKDKGVVDLLLSESINATDYQVEMTLLIQHDDKKLAAYNEYQEIFG